MSTEPPTDGTRHALALGHTYLEARNYRRAEEVLGTALAQDPQNPDLLIAVARAQHLLGDNAAAERNARRALAEEPGNPVAMRIYASILDQLERKPEGLEWARSAVDADPADSLCHYEYARLLLNADDALGAMPAARESLRLAPNDADAHNLMGMVLGRLGRRAESTTHYQEALRLDPGHAMALHNIAVNQANARKLPTAIAGFRQAAGLDPSIGDSARDNITTTVQKWLSWTVLLAWLALQVSFRVERAAGGASPAPRFAAGFGAAAMLVVCGWLARSLPRQSWRSMLLGRQREFLPLKIYIVLCVCVIGVLGAFALGAPIGDGVLLAVLVITVIVSWVAPRFGK